jgi:hypothetical protein
MKILYDGSRDAGVVELYTKGQRNRRGDRNRLKVHYASETFKSITDRVCDDVEMATEIVGFRGPSGMSVRIASGDGGEMESTIGIGDKGGMADELHMGNQ